MEAEEEEEEEFMTVLRVVARAAWRQKAVRRSRG